jgi:hypothetical protein
MVALLNARLFLLLFLGAALWMIDCKGDLSIQRLVQEKPADEISSELQKALGGFRVLRYFATAGCKDPEIPAQVAGSLGTVSLLLPVPADRAEFQHGLDRDYLFICAYTLAYAALAGLLRHRPGGLRIHLAAVGAAALAFCAASFDAGENYFATRVVAKLPTKGDYRTDIPVEKRASISPELEQAAHGDLIKKRACSYGKWMTTFLTWMILAFVFLERGRHWQLLAAGLLFAGGAIGVLLGFWQPFFIDVAAKIGACGIFVGLIILLGVRSPEELWTPPSE